MKKSSKSDGFERQSKLAARLHRRACEMNEPQVGGHAHAMSKSSVETLATRPLGKRNEMHNRNEG